MINQTFCIRTYIYIYIYLNTPEKVKHEEQKILFAFNFQKKPTKIILKKEFKWKKTTFY